jgi:hypothetical protein
MRNFRYWMLCLAVVAVCGSQAVAEQTAPTSFSDVFLTSDPKFAPGTNLCLVLDTPAGRGHEYDRLVAEHATAALQQSRRFAGRFKYVIFFVSRGPESEEGSVAAFTLTQLEEIAKLFDAGKEFNSRQSWVARALPKNQEDADRSVGR